MTERMCWREIEEKSIQIVADQLMVDPEEVTLNASFVEDLGADSLDTVELLMEFEDEFAIEIPDDLAQEWTTLGQALSGYARHFPRDVLERVDLKILAFRLCPDGKINVVLQLEDGSWTYADGHSLLPSGLCVFTQSRWTAILKDLEDLMNNPRTREADLQAFFEQYPELLAGDEFDTVIPQASIERIDEESSWRADFVLAPTNQTEFARIVELKLPQLALTKKPQAGHVSFSARVWDAISQLRDYGSAFDDRRVGERFKKRYGLDVYKPDLHLIAGRRWDIEWTDAIRALRRTAPVRVEDWDSVLARLRRRFT